MKKLFLSLLLLSSVLPVFNANQAFAEETKLVVTSFYPLAFITEQIVKDKAQVINMAGSVDVHAYDPSPQDLVKLNKAHLIVFQGAELESWTDSVIPELTAKGISTLAVSQHLELAKLEEHHEEEGHHDKEGHKENEEKHKDEEKHDNHHHGEFDPHTWLDPVLAQQMVNEILASLVKIDPVNKALYQANAQALKGRFVQLDQAFQTGLGQCANEELIISHDAYGYIARRYDFKVHAIAGFSSEDEPSAQILAELKKEAEEGISHILVEENSVRRFADTLARETGLKTLPANPLGRGTLDPQKDFFDIMEENLISFKTALNCQ